MFGRILDSKPSLKVFDNDKLMSKISMMLKLYELHSYFIPRVVMETDNSSQSCSEIHMNLPNCCPFFNGFALFNSSSEYCDVDILVNFEPLQTCGVHVA